MLAWRRRVGTGTKQNRQLGKRYEFFLLFRPGMGFFGACYRSPWATQTPSRPIVRSAFGLVQLENSHKPTNCHILFFVFLRSCPPYSHSRTFLRSSESQSTSWFFRVRNSFIPSKKIDCSNQWVRLFQTLECIVPNKEIECFRFMEKGCAPWWIDGKPKERIDLAPSKVANH